MSLFCDIRKIRAAQEAVVVQLTTLNVIVKQGALDMQDAINAVNANLEKLIKLLDQEDPAPPVVTGIGVQTGIPEPR